MSAMLRTLLVHRIGKISKLVRGLIIIGNGAKLGLRELRVLSATYILRTLLLGHELSEKCLCLYSCLFV